MEKAVIGRFDLLVFRAFKPLEPNILKSLLRLLKPEGFLAAWKGRIDKCREEILKEEKSLPEIQWEIHPLNVPFLNEERHLLVIKSRPDSQKIKAAAINSEGKVFL